MVQGALVLVAACALIDETGAVLLAQRPAHKTMGGLWEFPGGKIEPGEGPEDAAVRELAEELDVRLAPSDLEPFAFASHRYASFHLLMPLFLCRRWQGTPKALEHAALAWVRPQAMDRYELVPADIPLVSEMRARL